MNAHIESSKLVEALQRKNIFFVASMVLVMTVCIQSFVIWHLSDKERIVLVPPQLEQSVWLKGDSVSSTYLEQMSLFFIQLALNVTPDNASFMHQQLLKRVEPSAYGALKTKLANDADVLKRRNISTTFYPVNFSINQAKNQVDVEGDFETRVGKTQTSFVRKTYRMTFSNRHGQWFVSEFRELDKHEKH